MKAASFRLSASALAVLASLSLPGSSAPGSYAVLEQRLSDFVEKRDGETLIMNVRELDAQGLQRGSAGESIWSGDYWPLRYGGLALEYKNGWSHPVASFFSWKNNRKRFEKKWNKQDPRNLTPAQQAELTAAEKFDLLLGDYDLTLSRAMWDVAQEADTQTGGIKMWEGVCHGWATAAIQAPRPVKSVVVKSADGKYDLKFNPHDIKGLASWLWANSLIQDGTKFAGKRCNNRNRNFDPVTGMSDDPACNGVDPALFHLTLANLMGVRKESFVMNKNNDLQVWNQPIHSYRAKWFNVETGYEGTLDKAIMAADKLENDVRKEFRAPETKYVVGVNLELKYVRETKPNRNSVDSPAYDKIKTMEYMYDLELDEALNVVGGQWRNFRTDGKAIDHAENEDYPEFPGFPGFIWKIQRDWTTAYSISSDAPAWNVNDPIPGDFKDRAKQAARFKYKIWQTDAQGNFVYDENGNAVVRREQLRPQPLSLIVHGLLRAAKAADDHRTLE